VMSREFRHAALQCDTKLSKSIPPGFEISGFEI
jgi:hypothetical protein